MSINIISALTVYDVTSNKLRLGIHRDGGYVINEAILSNTKKLVTLGYGGEDSFENDWYERTHTPIDIYDGTCHCGNICNKYSDLMGSTLNYYNINVGNQDNQKSLSDVLNNHPDVLLKVDIEGGEYSVFDNINFDYATGILIELHNLEQEANRQKIISLLQNEFKEFILFHVHANAYGGTFNLNGVEFPHTLEISLINKKLVSNISIDTATYPITGIDFSNNGGADILLPWVNTCQP
jgi:hypothetical protein